MDIEGASTLVDFEVIDIIDDSNPYPVLLGIDWATDMNGVINLQKRKMIFEKKSLCVIIPLDPAKGSRYVEPVCNYENDDDLGCINKITVQDQYWVNPTVDGWIAWEQEISCTLDSNEEVERW